MGISKNRSEQERKYDAEGGVARAEELARWRAQQLAMELEADEASQRIHEAAEALSPQERKVQRQMHVKGRLERKIQSSVHAERSVESSVDERSDGEWSYLLHSLKEAPSIVRQFQADTRDIFPDGISIFRTDNGTEYTSWTLSEQRDTPIS